MSFNIDKCIIKQPWCGASSVIPVNRKKYYNGVGTRYECMKKGFGAGSSKENKKNIAANSLQNISYIGPKMESNFIANGISDIDKLKTKFKNLSALSKKNQLKNILINSDGTLNKRAYNSVISYLYHAGILNLPDCVNIP